MLEQRYELAIQRAAGVQLDTALRDATNAITHLLDVSTSLLLCLSVCLSVCLSQRYELAIQFYENVILSLG